MPEPGRRGLWFGALCWSIPGVGGQMVPPDTSTALGTAPAWDTPDQGLERGFPTPTALVLFVLKQHWEEIFS